MSDHYNQPTLGATFTPGGFDDFLMPGPGPPDVVSPSPQKVMPEVPANMQHTLATLELEDTSKNSTDPYRRRSSAEAARASASAQNRYQQSVSPAAPSMASSPPQSSPPFTYRRDGSYSRDRAPTPSGLRRSSDTISPLSPIMPATTSGAPAPEPNFSAFPRIKDRPAHVPPSADELLQTLEAARMSVLSCTDPEAQLTWAQDALTTIDIATEDRLRRPESEKPRPTTPSVERQLLRDAKNIVHFLADQHHPRAEFMKGMWLEFGRFGFDEDKKESYWCYSRAAERGYARAHYRIGQQYETTKEPVYALQHYNVGMNEGDSACCYRLGMMSLLGQLGQPLDYQKAVHLLRKSADLADENAPQGAYVYGMLEARELPQIEVPEIVLPTNIASARSYIEKSAFLGFSKAQSKLGSAYELCTLGCDFNPALSMHYNRLAARQGEAEAQLAISRWFLCGADGVFAKNDEQAFIYARRAAAQGLPMAQFAVGYYFEVGIGTAVDLHQALEWYKKAAKEGNEDALARIDGISHSKTLSRQDHEKVAVSRIKSQHGSRRGSRPERFSSRPVQTMPTLADESSNAYPQPYTRPPPQSQPPPAQYQQAPLVSPMSAVGTPAPGASFGRPSTAAPYPEDRPVSAVTPYPDDRPISTAPYPVDRPVSIAPYPLDDAPPRVGLSVVPPGGIYQHRPASAQPYPVFPNQPGQVPHSNPRPNSAYALKPQDPMLAPSSTRPRPSSSQPAYSPNSLSPNTAAQSRPQQGPRITSAPLASKPAASPPATQQSISRPSVGRNSPQNDYRYNQSASPNPSTSSSGTRPPAPPAKIPLTTSPPVQASSPASAQTGPYSSRPRPTQPNLPQNLPPIPPPGAGMSSNTLRPSSSTSPNMSNTVRPLSSAGTPSTARPAPGAVAAANTAARPSQKLPSTAPQAQSQPARQKLQNPGPGQGTAGPKKGAKTFDEMGVPVSKDHGDCLVM